MPRWSFHLACLSVAVVAAVMAARSGSEMVIWIDSVKYASASEHMAAGEGLRNDVLHWWDKVISDNSAPFTVHPPMLSLCYALLGGVTVDRIWPAQVWAVVFHMTTALTAGWLAMQLAGSRMRLAAGFVAGLATAIAYPLVWLSGVMMAEGCCTAMGLLSIACLVRSRQVQHQWLWWLAASAAAAAAFQSRYAMVAFGAALAWEVLVIFSRSGWRNALRAALPLILPMALTVLATWTHNYLVTGTIRGYLQPEQNRGLPEALLSVLDMSLFQFSIWSSLSKRTIIIVLFLLIPMGLWIAFSRQRIRFENSPVRSLMRTRLGPSLIALSAYVFIVSLAMCKYQPRVEERFLAPIAPLMLILVTVMATAGWQALATRTAPSFRRKAGKIGVAIWLLAVLAFVGSVTMSRQQQDREQNRLRSVVAGLEKLETCRHLVQLAAPESLVVSNRAAAIVWHTSLSAMELPSEEWEPLHKNPPNMEAALPERMKEICAKYLVLFADPAGLRSQWYGEHVALLSRRAEVNPKLKKVFDCPDGVIYELNP